tara:strand:- start:2280 stop:2420 length:141 start_codon:yes stop_codon:yes gene_type:complete
VLTNKIQTSEPKVIGVHAKLWIISTLGAAEGPRKRRKKKIILAEEK